MISGAATKKQERTLQKLLPTPPDSKDAFILKTANDWVTETTKEAPAGMLFGEFWYEGELCILFADTNTGKSILAVQLAEAIARGDVISPQPPVRANCIGPIDPPPKPPAPNAVGGQNVLYFDFELSAKQFGRRYSSDTQGAYRFANGFYRIVLNPKATGESRFKNFADYIENALENLLITTGARIVIIDNLTCLRDSTETAPAAIRLMRSLRGMRQKYGLSLLVLAHTPKRKADRPLSRNDLQGSKMLLNFADSAFAIGESQTNRGLRYLKQIKQRSTTEHYGPANICLCSITKPGNFLKFKFEGPGAEAEHLLPYLQQQRQNTEERVQTLRQKGRSLRQIATETGLPVTSVARMLKKLIRSDETEEPARTISSQTPSSATMPGRSRIPAPYHKAIRHSQNHRAKFNTLFGKRMISLPPCIILAPVCRNLSNSRN